jgi:hypothetical protein
VVAEQAQPWNGHLTTDPLTSPPKSRCVPRCGQCPAWQCNKPLLSRHRTTSRSSIRRGTARFRLTSLDQPIVHQALG